LPDNMSVKERPRREGGKDWRTGTIKRIGPSAKKVLFICTQDSARAQMAKALINAFFPEYEARSAGLRPSSIDPRAIAVMKEIGIDISNARSKSIEEMLEEYFEIVATVCDCAREECPVYPGGTELIHHGFPDPAEFKGSPDEIMDQYRHLRDDIRAWLEVEFRNRGSVGRA
jgi:arsenate reductase (thioredoxin)